MASVTPLKFWYSVPSFIEVVIEPPPGLPDAEGEIRPVGRAVVGGCGTYQPVDLGVRQGAACEVFGFHGHSGRLAHKIGAGGFVARGDFELGAAEFLDLEAVRVIAPVHANPGIHLDAGIAQVDPFGQGEVEVKTAQGVDVHTPGSQVVALRIEDLVVEALRGCRRPDRHHHPASRLCAGSSP